MLKRMGLGMVLLLISGLCTLVMGVTRNNCKYFYCGLSTYLVGINTIFLIIQFSLNILSYLLIYVSSFEFIRASYWNIFCYQRCFSVAWRSSPLYANYCVV